MKNKDFEYTRLKIEDEVVSAKVNELARKDLIAFANNCPPDYRGKSLAWDPDFIAEIAKRHIELSISISKEQQKIMEDSKKKMDKFIACINESINKKILDLPKECHSVEIHLICNGEIFQILKCNINHDAERE